VEESEEEGVLFCVAELEEEEVEVEEVLTSE